ALDVGVNEKGMVVPERPVAWEKAFPIDILVKLRAPFVRLDVARGSIEVDDYAIDPITETLVRTDNQTPPQIMSTDYGPAIWSPADSSNYTVSRSQAVSAVVIHTTEGSYAGTIS